MAIDGKNNIFEQQFHSGLHYINHKGTENIVLIGMINPLHEFMVALQLVVSGWIPQWERHLTIFVTVSGAAPLPHWIIKDMLFACTGDDKSSLSM